MQQWVLKVAVLYLMSYHRIILKFRPIYMWVVSVKQNDSKIY